MTILSNVVNRAGGLRAFLIQVISLVLGSSVILFGITTLYNDFVNKPDIDIKIIPSDDFDEAQIIVTNNGIKPATDVVLTIKAPGEIPDSPNIINTQNLTAIETSIDSNLFQLSVPRLVHGNGSIITVDMNSTVNSSDGSNKKYTVYATYNEGSEFETKHEQPALQEIIFGPWFDTLTILAYLDIIAGVSVIIFTIPFAHRISHNRLMREHAKFISKILNDIITIRNTLQMDISYNNKIPENWSLISNDRKLSFIDNIKDYVILDRFYTNVIIRNSEISNKDIDYIKQVNHECLELAEITLDNINWKEYSLQSYVTPHKSPLIASVMALLGGVIFLAGIGHIYVESLRRAIILLIFSTILRILTLIAVLMLFDSLKFTSIDSLYSTTPPFPGLLGLAFFSIYTVVFVWQIFDAKKLAKEFNSIHLETKNSI